MAKEGEDWTKFSEEVFGDLKKVSSNSQKSQKSVNYFQRSGARHQPTRVERLRTSGGIFIGSGAGMFLFNFIFYILPTISYPELFWPFTLLLLVLCLSLILLGYSRLRRAKLLAQNRSHPNRLDQEQVKWHVPESRSDFARDLEILARDDPENSDPDFWFYLGEDRLIKKDLNAAKIALKSALNLEPRFPAAWFRLGHLFVVLQDYIAAKEALKGFTI